MALTAYQERMIVALIWKTDEHTTWQDVSKMLNGAGSLESDPDAVDDLFFLADIASWRIE